MLKPAFIKKLLLNVGIFIVVFALDILKTWNYIEEFESMENYVLSTLQNVCLIMGLIWINHLVLIRYFFDRKKYFVYGILLFLILFLVGYSYGIEKGWHKVMAISFFYSYTTGMGMGAFFLRRSLKVKKEINEKEQLQHDMEINYLKAQVNPHFLFNTLNSIYSLSLQQSLHTPEAVMQLSELMRYQLESARLDTVFLKEELAFLENYLLLEEQRLSKRCKFEFVIEGSPGNLRIAPMLFIPFAENAVKHGAHSTNEESEVEILVTIKNNQLDFIVKNTKPAAMSTDKRNGMGLENVKRRLNLLYPGAYTLEINEKEGSYEVVLHINLAKE